MNTTEIKKIDCNSCDGLGYLIFTKQSKCDKCDGLGWTENTNDNLNEQEIVCMKCDGTGIMNISDKQKCEECNAKGYFIDIVKIEKFKVECNLCHGRTVSICHKCDNHGYIKTKLGPEECPNCKNTKSVCYECEGIGTRFIIKEIIINSQINKIGELYYYFDHTNKKNNADINVDDLDIIHKFEAETMIERYKHKK